MLTSPEALYIVIRSWSRNHLTKKQNYLDGVHNLVFHGDCKSVDIILV